MKLGCTTTRLDTDLMQEGCGKVALGNQTFVANLVPLAIRLIKGKGGLCQCPTNWWGTIGEHLVNIDFTASNLPHASDGYCNGGSISIRMDVGDVLRVVQSFPGFSDGPSRG